MTFLRICVLGRLLIERDGIDITSHLPRRAQELFCYLLIHRQVAHPRERLCEFLWGETAGSDPRKMLRQTLWQLKSTLTPQSQTDSTIPITVDGEWVVVNAGEGLCFDVAQFEQAADTAYQHAGTHTANDYSSALRRAIDCYTGELLPNWYSDWCLLERERLQNKYLTALDNMAICCEARMAYDDGLHYIETVLHIDRVNENAWRQMMRLHNLRGDRASALRQFERCAETLRAELNILPSRQTIALRDQIRDGTMDLPADAPAGFPLSAAAQSPALTELVQNLNRLHKTLVDTEREFRSNLHALMQFLNSQR